MADPVVIYFHGIPGGPSELNLFGDDISARTSHFVVLPRDVPGGTSGAERFAALADAIKQEFPERPLRLIGFSLGAAAALRTAPLLGAQVEKIDLISAAAPLPLGDYLGKMAGAPVFRTARDHLAVFGLLSKAQSLLASAAPGVLYSALFRAAQCEDIGLRDNSQFRAVMTELLKASLGSNLDVYRAEILAYVSDWSPCLAAVTQPVSIYHGRADNWSPTDMATDLAAILQDCHKLELMEGCSHYSALKAFLQSY